MIRYVIEIYQMFEYGYGFILHHNDDDLVSFVNEEDAKKYIRNNSSIFEGKEYKIKQLIC